MNFLLQQGYEVVPINPNQAEILGQRAYPSLEEATEATGPFDLVDVFRRPEHTPEIARSAVATGAGALWLQIGIVNWEAARIAHEAGLPVVMDRCTSRRAPPHRIADRIANREPYARCTRAYVGEMPAASSSPVAVVTAASGVGGIIVFPAIWWGSWRPSLAQGGRHHKRV